MPVEAPEFERPKTEESQGHEAGFYSPQVFLIVVASFEVVGEEWVEAAWPSGVE